MVSICTIYVLIWIRDSNTHRKFRSYGLVTSMSVILQVVQSVAMTSTAAGTMSANATSVNKRFNLNINMYTLLSVNHHVQSPYKSSQSPSKC
jgi:hypothetical protein